MYIYICNAVKYIYVYTKDGSPKQLSFSQGAVRAARSEETVSSLDRSWAAPAPKDRQRREHVNPRRKT